MTKKVDTLYCDEPSCCLPVWDIYEPGTVMIVGRVTCKNHGGLIENFHIWAPPDAEVPAVFRYVGP